MWQVVRRCYRAGENAGIDAVLDELRDKLEENKPVYDFDEEDAERMAALHDDAVQEQEDVDRAAG